MDLKENKTIVIAAFPRTGKTYAAKNNKNYNICDLNSSLYSWLIPGIKNENFPENYIRDIKNKIESNKYDFIFVSTHPLIFKALNKYNIDFTIVLPERNLKYDYLKRIENKGYSKIKYINLLNKSWDKYIDECLYAKSKYKSIILKKDEYINDLITIKNKKQINLNEINILFFVIVLLWFTTNFFGWYYVDDYFNKEFYLMTILNFFWSLILISYFTSK